MKFFDTIYLETETTTQEREVTVMMMIYGDKEKVVVAQHCPCCGAQYKGCFNTPKFDAWRNGALIQDVMPDAPIAVREWLISGICPDCQDSIFGEEE